MEADTVVLMITIVGSVLGSTLTTIGLLMSEIRGLGDKSDLIGRDVANTRERVARIEGYLMPSGGFALQRPEPPPGSEAPPEDPAPDRRQAS